MLEKSIKDHDNNREGRLKELEKKIKAVKAQRQSSLKDLKVSFHGPQVLLKRFYPCYIAAKFFKSPM